MHVLLVGPDLEENLSLRYLSSSLKAAGHTTTIATFDTAEDHASVVAKAARADLIGLSLCYQVRAAEFLTLARALKQQRPDRPVVAGGHFASCAADDLLSNFPELDVIVIHEGEKTLVELASHACLTREVLQGVKGIVFRGASGVVATPPRETVGELDAIPAPDRTGPTRLMVGVPTAYLMGSRGCMSACDYCCITTLHRLVPGKRFRQRTVQNIAEEMAGLYHDRGVRQFIFHDDNFLVPSVEKNLERIEGLDRELRHRGVRHIGLVLKCRPEDVDRQVFLRLREMGLLRVFLGIESGSAAGLASLGRRQTIEDEHRALRVCEELGISTQYTIIIFHPEATVDSMLEDLSFVREHLAHPMSYCRAETYAGTPLEKRMIASSRAYGNFMGRVYRYTDPATEVAWAVIRDLLFDRCWSPENLMGQVIRIDHLATVFRHFYDGRKVDALKAQFDAFEAEVNRDTLAVFDDGLRLVRRYGDMTSPDAQRALVELTERERVARAEFQGRACGFRERLHEDAFAMMGLAAQPMAAVAARPRTPESLQNLPRHAAAVLLAMGVIHCGSSVDVAPSDGGTQDGGYKYDGGIIEAPPPPFRYDGGVIEAPPPPFKYDGGVIEAAPPPVKFDGGIIEAPPPPFQSDAGVSEMPAAILRPGKPKV